LLVTVNKRLKFEIEIIHDLSRVTLYMVTTATSNPKVTREQVKCKYAFAAKDQLVSLCLDI